MRKHSFREMVVYDSVEGYSNITLEPSSQSFVSVIFKDGEAWITSMEYFLERISGEELINNICGKLLVNNIDCDGYQEGNWLRDRTYDFEKILKCPIEEFGNYNYETILRFSNLCKAFISQSLKDDKIYYLIMQYSEDVLNYYIEGTTQEPEIEETEIQYLVEDLEETKNNKVKKVLEELSYTIVRDEDLPF